MMLDRRCALSSAWVALAPLGAWALIEVHEMRDARTCKGFEKSYAKCDDLPSCEKACEPVSCQFSTWGNWYDAGGCSGLCFRQRNIDVSNNECGTPCIGSQIESKECPREDCMVKSDNCLLSVWGDWSACNSAVDQKYRYRSLMVEPAGAGQPCAGNLNETMPCDTRHPVDCALSEWGQWTECSATCNGGYHAAIRRVTTHAQHGGKACTGTLRMTEPCNQQPCATDIQDCQVGDWNEWAGCNFASPQQRYRTREIKMPALGGGRPCGDIMKQTAGCAQEPPQDCSFSDWSEWGSCDKTCGGGQRYRRRQLSQHPKHGGSCAALSNLQETMACGDAPCSVAQVCTLSFWSEWSACSASCDMGVHERSREMVFGDHARRLSFFDTFADGMVEAQKALPQLEDCSGGFSGGLREVAPCENAACPRQDCLWGEWAPWSACTCTCGGGTMRRNRVVAAPPGKGGRPCEPEGKSEVAACNTFSCEVCVDGSWGVWSDWSACSVSCGSGMRSRHRDVLQHPNHCGKPVTGVEDDFAACDAAKACEPDMDCELSDWTAWTHCSDECYGVTERLRSVVSFPSGRGRACLREPLKEMQMCNPAPDTPAPGHCAGAKPPSACQLATWGDWGSCSSSCGSGQRERLRHVLSPATKGGPLCNDTLSQTVPCTLMPCPVNDCLDCKYGDWGEWGQCSKCGGQRYRHRNVVQMPSACGKPCDIQDTKQAGQCESECEEEHWCSWSEWSSFGECSAECGPAQKSRQRVLAVFKERPTQHLFSGSPGMTCEGVQLETVACQFHSCTKTCEPKDCDMSEWGEWSAPSCGQLCERTRTVKSHGECGGRVCSGHLVETRRCEHECQPAQDCLLSSWQAWSGCDSPHDQKFRKRSIVQEAANGGKPCQGGLSETLFCSTPGLPEPCELSGWSAWSSCTKSCFGGLKQRTRAIRKTATNNGEPCHGGLEELAVCNQGFCSADVKDCFVGSWGEWSHCSKGGQRSRERTIEEPTNGGTVCEASMNEIQECSQASDCRLSDWSDWNGCDKTCDGGQQERQRQVVQNPHSGGKACPPSLMETRGCNEEPCHKVDCVVGEWGNWGECSATCGAGQRQRSRAILQQPRDGGLGCGLELTQLEACAGGPCGYVDCLWSDWKDWSDCSCSCDGGQRTRNRAISREPARGGKPCFPLSKEEVGACNTHKCSEDDCVDGQWGEWSDWEKCSRSCEGGVTWRTRPVKVEANHCGRPAVGDARIYASCNKDVSCVESVDCLFADWGTWSDCSSDCDGVMRRSRTIALHGRGDGAFCVGPMKQTSPCNPGPGQQRPLGCGAGPAVDCQLGSWEEWGECTASCGGGSRTRSRDIVALPAFGGQPCVEALSEVEGCFRTPCSAQCEPEDCAWGDWGDWSACDKCGGQQRRFRHILSESSCGGSPCNAQASEETTNCTRQCHAPAYCMWGNWDDWSTCSATCGNGEKSRTRQLQLTSEPQLQLVGEFDASVVPAELLQEHVQSLQQQANRLHARRMQELTASFACGGVTLVAGFALLRLASRGGAHAPRQFSRVQLDDGQ